MVNNKYTIIIAITLLSNYSFAQIPSGYNELAWGQTMQTATQKYPGGTFKKDVADGYRVTKYIIKNPSPTINEREFVFDDNSKLIKVHVTYNIERIANIGSDAFLAKIVNKFGSPNKKENAIKKVNGVDVEIHQLKWESNSTRILLQVWNAVAVDGAAGVIMSYLGMDHQRRINQKKISEIDF